MRLFDTLILVDQREGEERKNRKLQEAMQPFSNNNTERPSEMLESMYLKNVAVVADQDLCLPFEKTIIL